METHTRGRGWYPLLLGVALGVLLTGVFLPMTADQIDSSGGTADLSAGLDTGASGAAVAQAAGATDPTAGTASAVPGALGEASAGGPNSDARRAAGETGQGPGQAGAAAAGGGSAAATEKGVTASGVEVGALLFDLGGVGRLGFGAPGADAPQQRQFYEAFIADLNDAGGVAGRRVQPRFESFDAINADDQRRACIALTEDAEVFAIMSAGGFFGPPTLCVTEEHGVPLIGGQGEPDEWYRRSRGLLVTAEMSANRMARTQVERAHAEGRLKGATIGVLQSQHPYARLPAEQDLVPLLNRLGYKVAHITRLSEDVQTASSQIPGEVAQMRTKGVTVVLASSNAVYVALWLNQADAAAFHPLHILSDIGSQANDFTVQAAPNATQALAYTVMRQGDDMIGAPVPPDSADCQRRFQKRTGQTVERGSPGFEQLTAICGTVALFARAAGSASPLTRPAYSSSMLRLGTLTFPDVGGTISFRSGKFDGADFVRTKVFDAGCRCFIPRGQFEPASS